MTCADGYCFDLIEHISRSSGQIILGIAFVLIAVFFLMILKREWLKTFQQHLDKKRRDHKKYLWYLLNAFPLILLAFFLALNRVGSQVCNLSPIIDGIWRVPLEHFIAGMLFPLCFLLLLFWFVTLFKKDLGPISVRWEFIGVLLLYSMITLGEIWFQLVSEPNMHSWWQMIFYFLGAGAFWLVYYQKLLKR